MGQTPLNIQSAEKRRRNFGEVSLGYSKQKAIAESRRCTQCAIPLCSRACPLGIDIPGFIRDIRENVPQRALKRIKEANLLSSLCGRVCSAPCEKACVFEADGATIAIRALERFAADQGRSKENPPIPAAQRQKVALIGTGPSAMTAASELSRRGFPVTMFESLPHPGGILRYGIPAFRLPAKILNAEIVLLEGWGTKIRTDFFLGTSATLEDLKNQGFAAIILALGAGVPALAQLPGANLGRVLYAEEFLMRVNLFSAHENPTFNTPLDIGRKVAVLGTGYAALDSARIAVRLGCQVNMIFECAQDDLRVRPEDGVYAQQEGVHFEPLVRPLGIVPGEGNLVSGLQCSRMDFADPQNSGQWKLVPVPGSEFVLAADTVIISAGHLPASSVARQIPGLKVNEKGTISVDAQSGQTSLAGVFACGNVVDGVGPLVGAIASGKKAARKVEEFLAKKS